MFYSSAFIDKDAANIVKKCQFIEKKDNFFFDC